MSQSEELRVKSEEITARSILRDYLANNGYDGLVNDFGECGCSLDEIGECDESCVNCKPAYFHRCDQCNEDYDNCEWYPDGCFSLNKRDLQKEEASKAQEQDLNFYDKQDGGE